MKLQDVFKNYSAFLVDASGVLYEHSDFFAEAITTYQSFQKHAPTFLVTNNSYFYVDDIVGMFKKKSNLILNTTDIISSGHGLTYDNYILTTIENETIYFFGQESSKKYLIGAPSHKLTNQVSDSTVIILASYTPPDQDPFIEEIITHAQNNPNIPIICCNWDRHIRSGTNLMPVIGTIAKHIEDTINRPIYWFGKPKANFSTLVKSRLLKHNIQATKDVIFFDDNINNVVSMEQHIGITGCWVKSTGIYFKQSNTDLFQQFGKPSYMIDAFDLNANLIKLT